MNLKSKHVLGHTCEQEPNICDCLHDQLAEVE
jgi:hypothetical protein